MRTVPIAVVSWLLTSSTAHAQPSGPQPTTPSFRADVTRVEVTAHVVDSKGMPVADLGSADFTISEDGEPQVLRSFSVVSRSTAQALAEPAVPVNAAGTAVAAPTTNEHMADARIVALVLDDLHITPLRRSLAQQAARRVIERLAPSDLLYVVRTRTGASTGTFSRVRRRALALIDGLQGDRPGDDTLQRLLHAPDMEPERADGYRLLTNTLVSVSKALQGVLGHSKTMIVISEGSSYGAQVDRLEARAEKRVDEAMAPGGRGGAMSDAAMALADVRMAASAANVVIHTVSPTGLTNRVSDDLIQLSAPLRDDERRRIESEARQARVMLQDLADGTGGIAAIDLNDVLESVDRALARLDTHYLLSYDSSTMTRTRGQRRIEVRVTRPDARVHARHGYTPVALVPTALLSADDSLPLPMRRLLSTVVPLDDVRMRAQAVAVDRNAQGTTYAVVVEAQGGVQIDADGSCRLEQGLLTVNEKGEAANGRRREIAFTIAPGEQDHLSKIPLKSLWAVTLPPGRHQLRVATLDPATGTGGAVYLDLDVSSTAREPDLLVASELQASLPTLFIDEQVRYWATPMPSATRVFSVGDILTARVPQEESVPLRASLVSADGQPVWTGASSGTAPGVRTGLEVPLDVAAGTYQLLVESDNGRVTTPIAVVETPE